LIDMKKEMTVEQKEMSKNQNNLMNSVHAGSGAEHILKSEHNRSFGDVIKNLRKERGISQEYLAKHAHIDRTTIARVESGKFKTLSMPNLDTIAGVLGIDLKTLILKTETSGESVSYRGQIDKIEFILDFPESGFRILSLLPKKKEFFFGKIELNAQKTVPSSTLPHPDQIYIHCLEGKMTLLRESREFLLKQGDHIAYSGLSEYEFYNPEPLKLNTCLLITYPSFLPL